MLLVVVLGPRDGVVDGLAEVIVHEGECGSCVGDGGVAAAGHLLAADGSGGALELPEAAGAVDGCPIDLLAGSRGVVDVPECVEGDSVVRVVLVLVAAEVSGEQLGRFGDVGLFDHVLDRRGHGLGANGVDGAECQAQEAVADAGGKLIGQLLGQFNGLIFDDQITEVDVVGANITRCIGAVSVRYLPRRAGCLLERTGLCGVKDVVSGSVGLFG